VRGHRLLDAIRPPSDVRRRFRHISHHRRPLPAGPLG
jgi:hypothetical protein